MHFAPGESEQTVGVTVRNDAHDEGSEPLTLTLSHPFDAQLADGTTTEIIVNTDPIPKAWIARFGCKVAEQALKTVGARKPAPRAPGVEVSLAGQRIGDSGARSRELAERTGCAPSKPRTDGAMAGNTKTL